MLYMKGKVNSGTLKEPEGKKPFYNLKFINANENASTFTSWYKIYARTKLNIGDEIDVQMKGYRHD